MNATGARTRKQAVHEAPRRVVRAEDRRKATEKVRRIGWEGDLDKLRRL